MAMIGSFYAPEEWVQPNQRNIGDSLLDLYKMKRQIEADRQAQEAAKMEMELKRMEMNRKVEEEKRQKEYVKQIGNLANQYQKTQALPEKVKAPAATNLAALFAGAAPGMMGAAGVMNRAMQGSFPQQFATPRMGAEELQRGAALAALQAGDPEKMSAALKLLSPTQTGRTFEEQSALNAQMHEFRLKEIQARGVEAAKKLKLLEDLYNRKEISQREYEMKKAQIEQDWKMDIERFRADTRQDLAVNRPVARWTDQQGNVWYQTNDGAVHPAMIAGVAPAPGAAPAPMPPSLPLVGQAEPAPGNKVPSMAGAGAPSMDLPPMDATKAAFEDGRLAGWPGAPPWTVPTGPEGAAPASTTAPVAEPAPVNRPGQQFNVGKTVPKGLTPKQWIDVNLAAKKATKIFTEVQPQFRTLAIQLNDIAAGRRQATGNEMAQVLRAKLLDPSTGVKEGEVNRWEGLTGFRNQIENFASQFDGDRNLLTPQRAQAILQELQVYHKSFVQWKDLEENFYDELLQSVKEKPLTRSKVLPVDWGIGAVPKPPTAKEAGLPPGFAEPKYELVNGVWTLGTRGPTGAFHPLTGGK